MLKKIKNEIFKLIESSNLGIVNFTITPSISGSIEINTLKYKDSQFEFVLRVASHSFELFDFKYTKFAPSYPVTSLEPRGWIPFEQVSPKIERWLNNDVKKFLEEEGEKDLWEEFSRKKEYLGFDEIDFNTHEYFSSAEKEQISSSIKELKLLIQESFKTNSEEQKLINERLDYIVEASARLNKFDWKSIVISTLISITTNLTFDTSKGQQLFLLFKKAFSTITHLIGN